MVHKIVRKMYPENLKGKFTRRNQISKHETRRTNDLQIPKPRLDSQREIFRTSVLRSGMIFQTLSINVESTHLFKPEPFLTNFYWGGGK